MYLTRRGKRRLLALGLIMVICCGGAATYKLVGRNRQQRMLSEARAAGLAAHRQGDLETALERLSEYFTHVKDDLEVNLAFADTRAEMPNANGQYVLEAIDLFNRRGLKLIDQTPDLPNRDAVRREVLGRLMSLYELAGMRFELIQTADRILENEPDCVEALKAKAGGLYVQRDFEGALPVAEKLSELEPGNLAWRQLQLEIKHRQGIGDDELLALCDAWTDQWQGADGRFHLLKAAYLTPLGRLAEARDELARAAEKGAGSLIVLQQMVSLMDRLNMGEEASQVIADAAAEFPEEQWVAEATVQRLWQAGRISEALTEIAAAEDRFESLSPGLLRFKALALTSENQSEEAIAALDALRQRADGAEFPAAERAWADALQARLSLSAQSQPAALATFRNALALQQNDPVIHYLLGEVYTLIGEHSLALSSYELAHRNAPDWAAASIAYAESLLGQGLAQEAYEIASRLLNQTPTQRRLPVMLLYCRAHLALRQAGGAPSLTDTRTGLPRDLADVLLALRAQLPDHPQIAAMIAENYVLTDRSEQAVDFLREVEGDEATAAPVLLALADVSRQYGLEMDHDLIRRARQIDGRTLPIAFAEADCLARDGNADKGLRLIDEAMASHPDEGNSAAVQQQRIAYLLSNNQPDAMASLTSLIDAYAEVPAIQTFALAQPAAWEDRQIIAKAIGNLRDCIGTDAQQVRLAEARELVIFESDNEASLAKAIMIINGVIEQSPHSLAALSLMAEASLRGDHPSPDRAIEHLERAVAQYPGQAMLYPRLIGLLQQQGDYESAQRYLSRFSQLARRDAELMRAEMALLQAQGDFQAALLLASRLVDDEASQSQQLAMAILYQQAGKNAEAEALYQRLLEQCGPRELIVAQAAEFYARTGRFDRGVALIESMPVEEGSAARSTLLGMFHLRHESVEEAGKWLTRAVEEDPNSPAARDQLARYYLATGDPQQAQQQAAAGLKANPDNRALRATMASAGFRLGDAQRGESIELLRKLGAENDGLLDTLQLLERIPVVGGMTQTTPELLEDARRLAEKRTAFLPAWHLAVTLHAEAGRTADALELARRALRYFPTRTEPAEWTTQLLAGEGRWDEALVEAEEWRLRTIDDPLPVDVILASILLQLNRPEDAAAQLEAHADRLWAQRDQAPGSLATWVRALAESGRFEQAADLIKPLLHNDPAWRELWTGLARRMDVEHSRAALDMLESLPADDPAERLLLAAEYNRLGKRGGDTSCFDRADRLADEMGRVESLRATSLLLKGTIAEARGEPAKAEPLYRAALELEPQNTQALNNLAFVLTTTSDRHDEALRLARQALEASPEDPDYLDTLAEVLLNLGRPTDAIDALRKALAARPNDVSIGLNLVDALLDQRQDAAAESVLENTQRYLDESPMVDESVRQRAESLERRLRQARAAVDS